MNVGVRLTKIEVILTPPPAPVRGNSEAWGKIDPQAFRETIRLLKAAGHLAEDDDEEETIRRLRADGLIRLEEHEAIPYQGGEP